MSKDNKEKKSFWKNFFSVIDEEDDDSSTYPEDESDDSLTSVLEGRNKKIVPVFEGPEEVPFDRETQDTLNSDQSGDELKRVIVCEDISSEDTVPSPPEESGTADSDVPDSESVVDGNRIESSYETSPDSYFFIHEGPALKSLYDLEYYLGAITEIQFGHHVDGEKNDFASWVEGVFNERNLADELKEAKDREVMHSVIKRFLDIN